jgi:hypothetical protein
MLFCEDFRSAIYLFFSVLNLIKIYSIKTMLNFLNLLHFVVKLSNPIRDINSQDPLVKSSRQHTFFQALDLL